MKKTYTLFLALIFTGSLMAQAPQSFKYQAVARNASGNVVTGQAVGIQISILQGSISGIALYVETFTPSTNGFGLINLNIGEGTVVSGNFASIDWSAGTYFVKIEMDITGGTTYEEYGTSQLLSVPYALHAKTAANTFSGNYKDLKDAPIYVSTFKNDAGYLTSFTETDPVFKAHVVSDITLTHITNWTTAYTERLKWDGGSSGLNAATGRTSLGLGSLSTRSSINNNNWSGTDLSIVNGGTGASNAADARTTLGLVIGTNIQAYDADLTDLADGTLSASKVQYNEYFITSAGTSGQVWKSDGSGSGVWITGTELAIGDSYGGGIVFWVDETGEHGLIAATTDQSTGIQWYNGSYTTTNAVRDGVYAGQYNTERIIANQGTGSYATQLCANYKGGNYGDWYLPSKYELNLMYLQKATIGGFASAHYWSSTEGSSYFAWLQYFYNGDQYNASYKEYTYRVRAVRAF